MREAVAFDVVGRSRHDRQHDARQIVGVHLVVARHHGEHVGVPFQGCAVARSNRGADALIDGVLDQRYACIADRQDGLRCRVMTRIIHRNHVVDPRWQAL